MSEAFAFELKLVDAVTATAKRQVEALKSVKDTAKKTQEALDFSKDRGRVEASIKKLTADPKGYVHLIKAQKELREQRNKLLEEAGVRKPESFAAGLMSKFSFAKLASAAAVGELISEGAMKVGESLLEGAKMAVELLTEGVKKSFEEAGKQETLRLGEKLSLGDAGAKEYREDVGRFSKMSGFDDDAIRALLLPARRAGMDQQSSRTAFAAASDVAAGEGRGGDFGRVQEMMNAFEHIKLKGGVQERLLPGMGVDVKGFYEDLGKQLKVSKEKAKKMAEEGKINPQLLLNTIYKGIERKQGGQLGTGAVAYSKTFEARLAKVKNLPNEFYKNLVDAPGFQKASDLMGSILERLDPEGPAGQRIMHALEGMFDKLTGIIGDPADAADAIAKGIEETSAFVADLLPDLKVMGAMLISAADAAADMVLQLRLAKAYGTWDLEAVDKIQREGATRIVEKKARELNRYTDEQRRQRIAGTAAGQIVGGMDPMVAMMGTFPIGEPRTAKKTSEGGVNVGGVNVHMHGSHKDPEQAGRKAGRAAAREIERARQHGGG